MSKTNREIALELTLAIVGKIMPADRSTREVMNKDLAEQVATAYNIILEKIGGNDEQPPFSPERPKGW